MAKLTPKQQRFVDEYLIDLNAAAAYRRAGYRAKTDHAAAVGGAKLVTKGDIAAAIAAAQTARSERTQLNQDYVLEQLKAQAELTGAGASHGARVQALKLLGLHLGMFVQRRRHEHTGPGGGPIKGNVTHDPGTDLLPYLDVIRLCFGGGAEVPPEGPGQPVDPAQATPQAGPLPPP